MADKVLTPAEREFTEKALAYAEGIYIRCRCIMFQPDYISFDIHGGPGWLEYYRSNKGKVLTKVGKLVFIPDEEQKQDD